MRFFSGYIIAILYILFFLRKTLSGFLCAALVSNIYIISCRRPAAVLRPVAAASAGARKKKRHTPVVLLFIFFCSPSSCALITVSDCYYIPGAGYCGRLSLAARYTLFQSRAQRRRARARSPVKSLVVFNFHF